MTEEQQVALVEQIVIARGGTLEMLPLDRPECVGGTPWLHACFDGVCYPLDPAYCQNAQQFVYWLNGQMHGPLSKSA